MQNIIANSLDGKDWIKKSASKELHYADICSAYIQSEAFRYLFEDIFNSAARIRVLARWAPSDLLSKSSDLKTYQLCKTNNIDFYIKQDFHGKVYGLAPHGVLIGSFNLTNRGFSITISGNDEAGVLIENDKDSDEYFDQLFLHAKKVDDYLYDQISAFVENNIKNNVSNTSWPDEISNLITLSSTLLAEKILVSECFLTTFSEFQNSESNARIHDLSLLSIGEPEAHDFSIIRSRFRKTKIFRWFLLSLSEQNDEVYFGKATALLHDHLFDDPKPDRQKVKDLLANLLSWIDGLKLNDIFIDRPSNSQRITLIK